MKQIKKMMTPGKTIEEIQNITVELMQEQMLLFGLFTNDDIKNQDLQNPLYKKYFMHGVSHFLGLDVHDVGSKIQSLHPGMLLTCEPGLYIPEEGIGIRIENNILVTESAPIDLTADIPVEVDEIEAIMQR